MARRFFSRIRSSRSIIWRLVCPSPCNVPIWTESHYTQISLLKTKLLVSVLGLGNRNGSDLSSICVYFHLFFYLCTPVEQEGEVKQRTQVEAMNVLGNVENIFKFICWNPAAAKTSLMSRSSVMHGKCQYPRVFHWFHSRSSLRKQYSNWISECQKKLTFPYDTWRMSFPQTIPLWF